MVLAELLPNVNELFQWKGILFQHTWYEVNKTAIMALVSTLLCILLFFVGSRKKKMVPTGPAERGRDGLRDRRGHDRRRGDG